MTLKEFIGSDEYHQQKRIVYLSRSSRKVKDLENHAHIKAMIYFKKKYHDGESTRIN